MSPEKDASVAYNSQTYFLDIVAPGSNSDSWILNLPATLRPHQSEIETLLSRVFSGRPKTPDNLELAQQMTLNWCISKCRKIGVAWDE